MAVAKRWTKEDEEFLINNYQKMSNKELSDKFAVTTISVQRKLSRLGLIRQVQKKWEDEEENFLKENFMNHADKELAEKYGVSEISIKRKLNRMGLKRTQKKSKKVVEKKEKKVVVTTTEKQEKQVKKETVSITATKSKDREYSILESFEVGESLFHAAFNDKGKVLNKFKTQGGHNAIIVNFHRVGRKILLETVEEDSIY